MPKRTPEEWATIAKIARDVRHVFVEGQSDARVLTHVLGYPKQIDVRSADEVDADISDGHSLCGGNKLRLVRLSNACRSINQRGLQIISLADADFGKLCSTLHRSPGLYFTDYANLPAYTFTEEWLRGFLLRAHGVVLTKDIWDFLTDALKFCFFSRCRSACGGHFKVPKISDHLDRKNGVIVFDEIGYIRSFYNVSSADAHRCVGEIAENIASHDMDHRHLINSNDLFDLLYILIRKMSNVSGAYPRDAVKSAFFAAADVTATGNPVLAEILAWKCEAEAAA